MRRLAVFASGSGSNFEALASACADGSIPDAEIAVLVCDRPGAGVVERARRYPSVKVIEISPKSFSDKEEYETELLRQLLPFGTDLVCLAGYMRIVGPTLLSAFRDRMINLHPSLLPSFKGAHAIRDALAFGVKVFGCTIHYVDETLDGGRIISQKAVPYEGDDLKELTGIIHEAEHALYVSTVRKLLEGSR